MNVIKVRWAGGFLSWNPRIIVSSSSGVREYKAPQSILPSVSALQLRAPGALDRFREYVKQLGIEREFWEACATGEPTVFLFDLSKGKWQIPWELGLRDLSSERARAAYIPARVIGSDAPVHPSATSERLRVLILKGHPGQVPNRIRPDLEADGIVKAWERLDPQFQARIDRPLQVELAPGSLAKQISEVAPHVLWYCGHGRVDPTPGLLYGPNTWMSVRDVAAAIPVTSPPMCFVLWACELGEGGKDQTALAPAPEVHQAVLARGVQATLAMQSRINDNIARGMATEFFSGLILGLSPERAVARARHQYHGLPNSGNDWAAPVIWLARAPIQRTTWADKPADALLNRAVAWSTVKVSQKLPQVDIANEHHQQHAGVWAEARRVIVEADASNEAVVMTLASIADAAFRKLDLVPVIVRMSRISPVQSLQDWANSVLAWCDEESLPTPLGEAIKFALHDQQSTPRRLLQIDNALVIFVDPPDDEDANWFMDVIAQSDRAEPIVLIRTAAGRDPRFANWTLDRLEATYQPSLLEESLKNDRSTLLALAVLDLPLPDSLLGDIGFARERFPIGGPLTIETSLGPILPASVRARVLADASNDEIRCAHEKCLKMLVDRTSMESVRLQQEHLRHLIGAELVDQALEAAAALVETYFLDERYASAVECFESLKPFGQARENFDNLGLLRVAEAYVRVGKPNRAEFWLNRCRPENALQSAVLLALKSEIAKNSGSPGWRETALQAIGSAIEQCRKAAESPELTVAAKKLELEHTMTLARLHHYLGHDFAAAEKVYREIIAQASEHHIRPGLVAAAERNLAECVVSRHPSDPMRIQEAQNLLANAEQRLSTTPAEPLRAEIAYVRAKLEKASGSVSSVGPLLDACKKLAKDTGNGMVHAIARAWAFWLREQFSLKGWEELDLELSAYRSHGWAVRTVMNGRIRAAQHLAKDGIKDAALKLLLRNRRDIELRPGFDGGSDRDRIVLTLAGIMALGQNDDSKAAETLLNSKPWITEWLHVKGHASAADAWQAG